ncbi:hypothetical protein [Streptomyces sp. NPDC048442]|uniref:hypothetical protein n=1 Tax=Streptomyces sp. NPDC048442 TaxID=3154823 RepID=UPI0034271974
MINRKNTSPAGAAPEWVTQLAADPIHALGLFVHDWHQATEPSTTVPENSGTYTQDHLPPALTALDRLVRRHPTLRAFGDPLILPPKVLETHPNRLVFASSHSGARNWALAGPSPASPTLASGTSKTPTSPTTP